VPPTPIYTSENCTAAFQLNWSYALFWHGAAIGDSQWQAALNQALSPDGIRILQCHQPQSNVTQLLLSTLPNVAPQFLAQRVKGRLQHLIRGKMPSAFRRNYSLTSVGSTKREKLESYVARQIEHHRYADPRFRAFLRPFQIVRADTDLSQSRATCHALCTFNLHVVLEVQPGTAANDEPTLQAWHDMILRASQSKRHLLPRASVLPDHIHLLVGCQVDESPEQVALGYLNNLAYASGMKSVFRCSYFVGTFGEHDLGGIEQAGADHSLHRASSAGAESPMLAK
jgi:REP element-mobilizing transposase RayT